jgi:hypothetical protein
MFNSWWPRLRWLVIVVDSRAITTQVMHSAATPSKKKRKPSSQEAKRMEATGSGKASPH